MLPIRMVLAYRLSHDSLDTRLGQLACYLGAIAVVPTSVVALVKHPGSRADFLIGLGLSCLVGLLCAMVGTHCRRGLGLSGGFSLRVRWPEFVGYAACIALLVMGIRWLAVLGLTPAQVTIGLLLIGSLSLAVLVLGMMSSLVRSLKG